MENKNTELKESLSSPADTLVNEISNFKSDSSENRNESIQIVGKNLTNSENDNPNLNSNTGYADDEFDFVEAEDNTNDENNAEIDNVKNQANDNHLEKIVIDESNQASIKIEINSNKVIDCDVPILHSDQLEDKLNNPEKINELDSEKNVQNLNGVNTFDQSLGEKNEKEKNHNEKITHHIDFENNSSNKSEDVQENGIGKKEESHLDFIEETIENREKNFNGHKKEQEIKQENINENADHKELLTLEFKQKDVLGSILDGGRNENKEDQMDLNTINFIRVEEKNPNNECFNDSVDPNKNIDIEENNSDKKDCSGNGIKIDNNEEASNNDDFDFYEASEEDNKKTEVKDSQNDLNDGAVKVNIESLDTKLKSEDITTSQIESDNIVMYKQPEAPIDISDKREDVEIIDEKEDFDFQEREESEPTEANKIDSLANKNQMRENVIIEKNESEKDSKTKEENRDNQGEFIFEENIKIENKIHEFKLEVQKDKETEIYNKEPGDEEFDFVDETEENNQTNLVDIKENKSQNTDDGPKISKGSQPQMENESEENVQGEKDEFDAKKIMDYSFSSSEEEDNNHNGKKQTTQMREDNQKKEEIEQKVNIKTQQDNLPDNQERDIEDNIDNLEFEDCSENNENMVEKCTNIIKKDDNEAVKNSPEDEDVFDFVEEDNSETNTNNLNPTNNIVVKSGEQTENIDKNDDEFDFVEESEPQVNINNPDSKSISSNNVTQNNQTTNNPVFINKDHINNLLNNYRNKFIINNPNFAYLDDHSSINNKVESNGSITYSEKQTNENQENKINTDEPINSIKEIDQELKENELKNKQDIEEDEFLDVENEDEVDQDENKPNAEQSAKTQDITTKETDSKEEKRLKSFCDTENFTFEINESKYENYDFSQQAMGFEQKQTKEIYRPICIQKQIENLKFFNSEPEINMRGYSLEELNKLSKSYNTKLNIKNTIFNHGVMEFSNEVTRKLFFQFSDLRIIINNSNNLNHFPNGNKNSSSTILDNFSPLNSKINQPNNLSKSIYLKTDIKENNNNEENTNKKKSNEQITSTSTNNPNLNVSSMNNKESLNTTININNTSINDNPNKDRILENIKELKLLNEKNTDLFNKNKSNNQNAPSPNNQPQTNYLEALNKIKDSENNNEKKEIQRSPIIAEKPKPTTGIDLESNKVKMQMKEQKEIDSDSFDEIKEDDDDDDSSYNKPKFVMNEMMSSLFSAVNNNNNSNNPSSNSIDKIAKQEKIVEEKPKEVTEIDMLEMLKSIGITKKEEKSDNNKNRETERNNEKLNEIINRLPNLNYLTSKYVEIPDSIFNI